MAEPTADDRYTEAFDALLAAIGDAPEAIDCAYALSRAAGDLIAQRDNADVALMAFRIAEVTEEVGQLAGLSVLHEVAGILDCDPEDL